MTSCASLDTREQCIPCAIQRTTKADEHRERCAELRRFDELQAAGRDVRFFRKLLLSQPRLLAQPTNVTAQNAELWLRNALHQISPMLAFHPSAEHESHIRILCLDLQSACYTIGA